MRTIKFFILFFLATPSLAQPWLPGLVRVSTRYTDDVSGSIHEVTGHGYIISAEDKYFVVTASHLSQGRLSGDEHPNRKISWYNEKTSAFEDLPHQTSLGNNLEDIDIILLSGELPAELEPTASLKMTSIEKHISTKADEGRLVPRLVINPKIIAGRFPKDMFADKKNFHPIGLYSYIPNTPLTKDFKSRFENTSFQKIEDEFQEVFFDHERSAYLAIGYTHSINGLASITKLQPGMSGLPLFFYEGHSGNWYIVGTAIASSREFSKGFFSEISIANHLVGGFLDHIEEAKKQNVELTKPFDLSFYDWKYRDGLLYREKKLPKNSGNGVNSELVDQRSTTKSATGNSTRLDNGNSTRLDNGNSTRLDNGNSTRLDNGEHTAQAPKLIKSGLTIYNTKTKTNMQVLAIVAKIAEKPDVYFANSSLLQLLESQAFQNSPEFAKIHAYPEEKTPQVLLWFQLLDYLGLKKIDQIPEEITLDAKSVKIFPVKDLAQGTVSIKVKPSANILQDPRLSFVVTMQGEEFSFSSTKEFEPVISIKGSKGSVMELEAYRLYFTDLGQETQMAWRMHSAREKFIESRIPTTFRTFGVKLNGEEYYITIELKNQPQSE